MKLLDLLGENAYRLWGNSQTLQQEITCVTADPTRAGQGALLVCTRTALRDGYQHVMAAYTAGCRAFLSDRIPDVPSDAAWVTVTDAEALLGPLSATLLGHPARDMTVIGITGTAGKSAVAHTLFELFSYTGKRVASLTSDGMRIGDKLSPAGDVVPDAANVQSFLTACRNADTDVVLIELSAYMLAHKTAFSIPFAVVLLTNLFDAHIGHGEFASREQYHAAKLSLLATKAAFAVVPVGIDLPFFKGRILTVGEGGSAWAENRCLAWENGEPVSRFDLCLPSGEKYAVSLPVPGDFAIDNALFALLVGEIVGVDRARLIEELSLTRPKGRMECLVGDKDRLAVIDSAFEARALSRALKQLRRYTKGRLSVLIGSVGGRARYRRGELALAAVDHADFAYFTADDPNGEDPEDICVEMMRACGSERCCVIADRRSAIQRAVMELRPGDVLLIAGKGGCDTQLIGGTRYPFNEKEIILEALARL